MTDKEKSWESYKEKSWEVLKYATGIALAVLLIVALYYFVIRQAPPANNTEVKDAKDVLMKLGPRTAVVIITMMVGLMALVFWLFIDFGRRLSQRSYMGPLAEDAVAQAEIARRESRLKEDARSGRLQVDNEPWSEKFYKKYGIPSGEPAPFMRPGIAVDVTAPPFGYDGGGDNRRPGGNTLPGNLRGIRKDGETENPYDRFKNSPWLLDIQSWTAEKLALQRDSTQLNGEEDAKARDLKESKSEDIKGEILRRFHDGYQQEQWNAYYQKRAAITEEENDRARKLLPTMDASSFGGGWVFVLEFTTIIFIVFAVLALGLLGVLTSEPIAAILAAIAGYVLGKSTHMRGGGGEEIVRGSEEPKALFDALIKREERLRRETATVGSRGGENGGPQRTLADDKGPRQRETKHG